MQSWTKFRTALGASLGQNSISTSPNVVCITTCAAARGQVQVWPAAAAQGALTARTFP